jgi:hypothetical protein
MRRDATMTERELHDILWQVWSAHDSRSDVAELVAGISPSARDFAIELLRECGDVIVPRTSGLDPQVVELLAWSVFGTDSLPLLPPVQRKERLIDAAARWNVDINVVSCLAVRAVARLR